MSEHQTPENPQPIDPAATPDSDANPDADASASGFDEQVVAPEPLHPAIGETDAVAPSPFTPAEYGGHLLPTANDVPPASAGPVPPSAVPAAAGRKFAAPTSATPTYPAPGQPAGGYPASDASGHPPIPPVDGAHARQGDAATPPKKLPTGAVVGLVAAGVVVVLALAAGIAIPLLTGGAEAGDDGDTKQPTGELSAPAQYVADYLTAIADGDAATARSFIELSIYDDDLLTDEVLAMSNEAAPITDIEVGEPTESEYETLSVPVTFSIGDEQASRTFEVYTNVINGELSIIDGVERIPNYGFEAMPLVVNGVEVGERAVAFPGTYEFSVDSEYFAVEGGDVIAVGADGDSSSLFGLEPTLSKKGLELYRQLVDESLKECLAMTTIATPCGMDVTEDARDGFTAIDGTVTRTLTAEGRSELAALEPRVSENMVVTTSAHLDLDIAFDATNGTETDTFDAYGGRLLDPKVDFAAETPTVVWE